MNYRELGRTGIVVSEIGFGAWGIGGWKPGQLSYGPLDEDTAFDTLQAALDHGVNFFDTSPLYGEGRSEELVGRAVSDCRDKVVIASKAGYKDFSSAHDCSADAIKESVDASLRRLGTDYIDLLQLHDPSIDMLKKQPDVKDCLDSLVDQGIIRAYGISVKNPQDAVEASVDLDYQVFQLNFNMLDTRAIESGLFDIASRLNLGIIVRTPLCFGFLSGDFKEDQTFAENDHRSRWSSKQIERWARGARKVLSLAEEGGEPGSILAALRYCLSFSQVSTAIPGMMSRDQVAHNVLASKRGALPSDVLYAIREQNKLFESFSP